MADSQPRRCLSEGAGRGRKKMEKTMTPAEFMARANQESNVWWMEADGVDIRVIVVSGEIYRRYGLRGCAAGSIMVDGGGDGDAVRYGVGRGVAYRRGDGNGDACRYDGGNGNAVRDGAGAGNALRDGAGRGNAQRYGSGAGVAVREDVNALITPDAAR